MSASPSHIIGFDSQSRTRLVFGVNGIERVGELARELGAGKVLLVTDSGIIKVRHAARVQEILKADGVAVAVYDRVEENPTTRVVDECLTVAKSAAVDVIIGLGGGSSMDVAKGCNFLLTNGGRMEDYWGFGKASREMLPLIAIPTTAGTGSECQCYALISDAKTHAKMACGDPKAAARIAILDPMLTLTQPKAVAAATGMDAITHAVETAVTNRRNELSWLYTREAFRLTVTNLPLVLQHPNNLDARAHMQLGAALAGLAIDNSMLGAAHSAANPLTAHFDIIHGRAVGMLLPHVVRFNSHQPAARNAYAELMKQAGLAAWNDTPEKAAETLVERLEVLLKVAEILPRLSDYKVSRDAIPMLAQEASQQWTAKFNPREVGVADFTAIYEAAL